MDEEKKNNHNINILIKLSSISLSGEVIKKFFQGLTENLGKLILVNLLWFIFAIPIFSLLLIKSRIDSNLFLILFFPCLLLLASPTASVFNITYKILEKKDLRIFKDFFEGMARYRWKSIVLCMMTIIIFFIGFTPMWFYLNHRLLSVLSVIIIIAGFFVVLLAGLMQNYLFPLIVQKNLSIKNNIVNTIYFLFDSLGFSIAIFLLCLLTLSILNLSVVGIPLLFMSAPSFLYNLSFKMLLDKKYGMEDKIFDEKRGWKEFLFPIKSPIK